MDEKSEFSHLLYEGDLLYKNNNYIDAIKLYKTALIMNSKPSKQQLTSIYIRLGNVYYKLKDADRYVYYYEEYLKLYPQGQASVFSRLSFAYYYIDIDKCIDYHNKSLNIELSEYDAVSKIFAMTKSPSYSQKDVKEEAEYEVDKIKNKFYKDIVKYNHSSRKINSNKKLNIGYFSSDCYNHTMMNYLIPIWENHNRSEFNILIFSCSDKIDKITEKIKSLNCKYIECAKKNSKELAQTIWENETDILVDLSGYTYLKSFCFLYKPAPVIISYLGYLNTMGIKEVDYILTDKYTIDNEYLYTEKPLYLDTSYQIFDYNNVPNINDCPYKTNGYITYGSFNCSSKINDTMIYFWSQILKETENSKLLIYRTSLNKTIINNLKSKFTRWEIDESRVIYSNTHYDNHYRAYSNVDIALDTYPFSGMSIAIETALMGVPTVALKGEAMQSRGACRINEVIGNGDLNSVCGEEYIELAIKLAKNCKRLEEMRFNLRKKVKKSALCASNGEFTRDLEDKYKKVWQKFLTEK